jgi:CBS domain containing-hemolysin-like protein
MSLLFVFLAFGLVALNAFFVATEFAIVKVRDTRIEELVSKGVRRAEAARRVLRELDTYLSATQVGITLASLGLGWIGEPAFAGWFEPVFARLGPGRTVATHSAALACSFLLITFLHVVFGELAPKTLAIERPLAIALWSAAPIRLFRILFYPLIWALNGSAGLALRLLGLARASEASLAHSQEELRIVLSMSSRSGLIGPGHARILEKAIGFADRTVRQILIPRADTVYLDTNRSPEENLSLVRSTGHTRYPLCDGDLDRVVGIVHIKDLFLRQREAGAACDLREIAREPLFFPESLGLDDALAAFQKQHLHMALVLDEYGGTSGIVTLEDVVEELIGEIQDEFDQEAPKVQRVGDGVFLVDASLGLEEARKETGIPLETDEEVDTLGGLVLARLGRIARAGDSVEVGGTKLEVTRVRGRRILRVLVRAPAAAASDRSEPETGRTPWS